MLIEFDPVKDAKNRANHDGISLGEYAAMDLAAAIAFNSPRHGEARTVQVGPIAGRLHVAPRKSEDPSLCAGRGRRLSDRMMT